MPDDYASLNRHLSVSVMVGSGRPVFRGGVKGVEPPRKVYTKNFWVYLFAQTVIFMTFIRPLLMS